MSITFAQVAPLGPIGRFWLFGLAWLLHPGNLRALSAPVVDEASRVRQRGDFAQGVRIFATESLDFTRCLGAGPTGGLEAARFCARMSRQGRFGSAASAGSGRSQRHTAARQRERQMPNSPPTFTAAPTAKAKVGLLAVSVRSLEKRHRRLTLRIRLAFAQAHGEQRVVKNRSSWFKKADCRSRRRPTASARSKKYRAERHTTLAVSGL